MNSMSQLDDLPPVVKQLAEASSWLTGNITPHAWYKHIKNPATKTKPTGTADAIAIAILSDILYWYRPTEVRDEATGYIVGYKKKFSADKLQKSYQSYADFLGQTKKKIKTSMDLLVNLKLIHREFRTVETDSGLKIGNVMFVEPVFENVLKISTLNTPKVPPIPKNEGRGSKKQGEPPPKNEGTNTKSTTKSSHKNDVRKESVEPPKPEQAPTSPPSSFSELIDLVPEQFRKPSVEKTIQNALMAHNEPYVKNAILYTREHSNGKTWQKFKAYLGKTIDEGWADGWELETTENQIDQEATRKRFEKMQDRDLKLLADTGNVWAVRELERRGIRQ